MPQKLVRDSPLFFFVLAFIAGFLVASVVFYSSYNRQIVSFRPIDGPIVNPLMGWAPWATIEQSQQPHTLVYADLTWREFEPREGFYDFETFEQDQQLNRWRSEGKRIVFRFLLDYPSDEEHLDIPDWLFQKIDGRGDHYDHVYGKGFSPDYSNPILIEYHQKAIVALGERYGHDDFFAYIELGSLGHWGEWHVNYGAGIRRLPNEIIRDQYVIHYKEAFPHTYLLMRRPFSIAQQLELGLYNDMTGDLDATNRWLDSIQGGGEYSQTEEENALSAMPDGWKIAPVGGEQAGSMSDVEMYDTHLDRTLQLLQASHTTFIGPGCPYDHHKDGPLQTGIDKVLETIGYRLYIQRARLPRWVHVGKTIKLSLKFGNDGIAPIYYDWPTKIYLFDQYGDLLVTYLLDIDLRELLPGEFHKVDFYLPVDQLENGTYSLGLGVIDPSTNQAAVRFAMKNPRQDLIQEIGSFKVDRMSDRLQYIIEVISDYIIGGMR